MTTPVGGSTVSLQVGYVIKRGTCKACKDEGNESLIQQGDVYWTKGMGQYAKKYHFACFVPKFGSWKEEDRNGLLDVTIRSLKPHDRERVNALFGGEQIKPAKAKRSPKKKAEDEEDEGEAAEKPKKKSKAKKSKE